MTWNKINISGAYRLNLVVVVVVLGATAKGLHEVHNLLVLPSVHSPLASLGFWHKSNTHLVESCFGVSLGHVRGLTILLDFPGWVAGSGGFAEGPEEGACGGRVAPMKGSRSRSMTDFWVALAVAWGRQ